MAIEKPVRDYLRDRCRQLGWECLALIDPTRKAWPDRTILGLCGRTAFVEVKAEKSNHNTAHIRRQKRRRGGLTDMGHVAAIVTGKKGVDEFMSFLLIDLDWPYNEKKGKERP
jgi:hypothetical protein